MHRNPTPESEARQELTGQSGARTRGFSVLLALLGGLPLALAGFVFTGWLRSVIRPDGMFAGWIVMIFGFIPLLAWEIYSARTLLRSSARPPADPRYGFTLPLALVLSVVCALVMYALLWAGWSMIIKGFELHAGMVFSDSILLD